jgi:hypothetical protein
MSDFAVTWDLVRGRFLGALEGLTDEQLNRRLHKNALSIGEMALHVAGVEVYFSYQLTSTPIEGEVARLAAAATDGVVNDKPFPYSVEEITLAKVAEALALGKAAVEPLITNPDPYREVKIVSALGPVIDGTGAFARLAYHPAYHQAQVYLTRSAPDFN